MARTLARVNGDVSVSGFSPAGLGARNGLKRSAGHFPGDTHTSSWQRQHDHIGSACISRKRRRELHARIDSVPPDCVNSSVIGENPAPARGARTKQGSRPGLPLAMSSSGRNECSFDDEVRSAADTVVMVTRNSVSKAARAGYEMSPIGSGRNGDGNGTGGVRGARAHQDLQNG